MAARMQRTQILLEPEQHRALTDLAQAEGRSLSDIVREFIQTQLVLREHERKIRRQRQLARQTPSSVRRRCSWLNAPRSSAAMFTQGCLPRTRLLARSAIWQCWM